MANVGGNKVPEITGAEHISPEHTGDNISAKRVAPYEWDTASSAWVRKGIARTERYDIDSNPYYVGTAAIGTSEGATGWTITKYDVSSLGAANGKVATDVSWTDRASGTYA